MNDSVSSPYEIVLSKLHHVRQRGKTAEACCPAHDDRTASLSIKQAAVGRVLFHCHAGCSVASILHALELTEVEIDPELEAIYQYRGSDGQLLYEKLRRQGKNFTQRRIKEDGSYIYRLGDQHRVLYNLPQIASIRNTTTPQGTQWCIALVEGEKDADRLVEEGYPATTTVGGATAPWKSEYTEALRGLRVVIIPDNDDAGRRYASNAARALSAASIEVRLLELPDLPEHGDVSDWFDAGGTLAELTNLIAATSLWVPSSEPAEDGAQLPAPLFLEKEDGIYGRNRYGEYDQLATFTARITEDVIHDDGVQRSRKYRIASPQFSEQVEVSAAEFQSLVWVADLGGARAIVRSGTGLRSKLAEAIQVLSAETLKSRVVYTHVGWREIDGAWYYLHGGGAIGKDGPVGNIEVQTEGRLKDCCLPPVVDRIAAVRASLRFLGVAPARITYLLLAAIYRAPLSEAVPATTSLFFVGETGSRKSAITGIAQAHFGIVFSDGKVFIANWSSTGNSIERMTFLAKDMLSSIDDFNLKGTQSDIQKLQRTADQIIRGQGNRAGRSRMRADSTLRPEMFARGLVVASGEATPDGKSLAARMLVLDIGPDDVNNAILSQLQLDAREGLLAQAMSGYVQWLADKIPRLKSELPIKQDALRAQGTAEHARTSENTAQLQVGIEMFMAYAVEAGAITHSEATDHLRIATEVLQEQAQIQNRHIKSEDPIEHFFMLLRAVLSSANRGHLQTRDEQRPEPSAPLGWKEQTHERLGQDGQPTSTTDWRASGDVIGWIDGDNLYLESSSTFAAVKRLATDNGLSLPIPTTQLGKKLKERGLLLSTRASNENKAQVTVGGRTVTTVFHLSALQALGVVAPKSPEDNKSGAPHADHREPFAPPAPNGDDREPEALNTKYPKEGKPPF